ncbi:hypothetical protein [uncultured Tateyamaria sp.]|uniref:hypothetical protein n=1 Tax=uncultured Tateyamaria sp. TaxID=455651 RepID=UPI002621498D|nr:hypothetical protein [uncultured Tateyamaria sp.]
MVQRLIVHAGFHKTGTTSIQKALKAHRAQLRPHTRVGLRPAIVGLCEAARAYSVSRSALDLGLVQYEAAELASAWAEQDGTLLLSSEDLSGHMPGRRGLQTYDATPKLMAAMVEAWRAVLGDVAIDLVFTTREAGPWLASCHMQHLRATRITQAQEDYVRDYAGSADLDGIIDAVAAALPGVPVHRFPLEDAPFGRILALAGVPEDLWPAMPHRNRGEPDSLRAALLEINRSDLSDDDARAARKAAMQAKA